MSAQHTQGPWIASGNRVYMGSAMERREVAVATRADPSIRHAAEANARLIAAAPEMLAVLRSALTLIEALMPGVRHIALQDYAALNDVPMAARAAIRKAEGR